MRSCGKSDIGRLRKTNEDSYVCSPPAVFVVADGMGGHAAGEIASNICAKTVAEHLQNSPRNSNWQQVLREAVDRANGVILEAASTQEEYFGMGTTITAVYIEGDNAFWGHVGDSRLYLIRDGKILQITEDHSIVGELLKKGKINNDQAMVHPNRNVLTRAVGTEKEIMVDTGIIPLRADDKLLLCSDGLTNMVMEDEILKIIFSQNPPQGIEATVDGLIARANAAGGVDNITAILIVKDE